MIFGHDWAFWVALLGASLIRVATSPFHSIIRSVVMILTAVFVAWLLTDPAIDWLHLNPEVYRAPVGGILALTADGLVRGALRVDFSRLFNRILNREDKE